MLNWSLFFGIWISVYTCVVKKLSRIKGSLREKEFICQRKMKLDVFNYDKFRLNQLLTQLNTWDRPQQNAWIFSRNSFDNMPHPSTNCIKPYKRTFKANILFTEIMLTYKWIDKINVGSNKNLMFDNDLIILQAALLLKFLPISSYNRVNKPTLRKVLIQRTSFATKQTREKLTFMDYFH